MSQMKYVEEFDQQWTGITNYLVSEMLGSAQKGGTISVEELQSRLEKEKKKWKLPGQYEYLWLEKLRREAPQAARNFEAALAGVRLEQVRPADRPNSLLAAGPTVGGAAVGFGLTKLLDAATMMTVVGTVGLGVVGLGLGVGLLKQKQQTAFRQDREAYQEQLRTAGKQLSAIVSRADQ